MVARAYSHSVRYTPSTSAHRFVPSLPRRSYVTRKPPCECPISDDKIKRCISNIQRENFRTEMRDCQLAKDFHNSWEIYQVNLQGPLFGKRCKALEILKQELPLILQDKNNIKAMGDESTLLESHFSILSSKKGQVSLAGEGGKHVGKREYWEPILTRLQKVKHLPISILSIGGGIGFDAQLISRVFQEDGFTIQRTTVVDPNRLAAFLSDEDVDYYETTSQIFFEKYFKKQENTIYLFHLGTILNVVPEDQAVHILEQIAKNMNSTDAISIIMVDKKQFHGGASLKLGSENAQGFSKITNMKTGKHYKTVITNAEKFINFMATLGFKGDMIEVTEKGVVLNVAFVAYKALKEDKNCFK